MTVMNSEELDLIDSFVAQAAQDIVHHFDSSEESALQLMKQSITRLEEELKEYA